MRSNHRLFRTVVSLAAVTLAAVTSTSYASGLASSTTLFPAPGEADPMDGAILDVLSVPVAAPTFTGSLTTTVISGDTSNPHGGLTFTYVLSNDASSAHSLGRLTVNGYEGFLIDASFQTPATGTFPAIIDRTVADVVGFTFMDVIGDGLIAPGESSSVLVIQTNAPAYTGNVASVIDGFVATVPVLVPVPEPASVMLLGAGLALLAHRRRRA